MKKAMFQLPHDLRLDMMEKIIDVVRKKLFEHKLGGKKFNQIAREIGVPKTRISEVFNRKYLGENTLIKLVEYGYITHSDIVRANLSEDQARVVGQITGQVSTPQSQTASHS